MASKYIDIKSKKGGCIEFSNNKNGIYISVEHPECEEVPTVLFNKEELEKIIETLIELKEKL